MPGEHSLRPSLIGRLVRNRRWLGATALGLARLAAGDRRSAAGAVDGGPAVPRQRVDPAALAGGDAAGGEAWAEGVRGGGAIIAGVAGVALAAPERTTDHAGTGAIALSLGLIAIPIAAPYVLRADAASGQSEALPLARWR